MKYFYAVIISILLLSFMFGLWGGGIVVFGIFGCSIVGLIMLCHYVKFIYEKIVSTTKKYIALIKKLIKGIRKSIFYWLKERRHYLWGFISVGILAFVGVILYYLGVFERLKEFITTAADFEDRSNDIVVIVTSVAIGTIVCIMTIAFPLLINIIQNLNARYNTEHVVSEFQNSHKLWIFRTTLICSLILSVSWVIFYFFNDSILYSIITILLISATVLLVIFLMSLMGEIAAYMTPSKLAGILIKRIRELKHSFPSYYFEDDVDNRYAYQLGSTKRGMAENKRKYDVRSIELYLMLARIFALFSEDDEIENKIFDFWLMACDPNINNDVVMQEGRKYYPQCYYYLIDELFEISIAQRNPKMQDNAVGFLLVLLLPYNVRGKYDYSIDTRKCLWRSMIKCVNSAYNGMFREYWDISRIIYPRKYNHRMGSTTDYEITSDINNEKSWYLAIQYLCCSYLMKLNKFGLLDYVLYDDRLYISQTKYTLIPKTTSKIINAYLILKEWCSNAGNRELFSETDDINLFSDMITEDPIGRFTCLLLFLYGKSIESSESISFNLSNSEFYFKELYGVVDGVTAEAIGGERYIHLKDFEMHKFKVKKILSEIAEMNNIDLALTSYSSTLDHINGVTYHTNPLF